MQRGVGYPIFKCWAAANDPSPEGRATKKVDDMKSNDCVTAKDMAGILKVPISWIYRNANKGIPCFKAGKYLRFNPQEVISHLKTRSIRKEG